MLVKDDPRPVDPSSSGEDLQRSILKELRLIYLDVARIKRNVIFFFWIFILGFIMSGFGMCAMMTSMAGVLG